MQSTFAGFIGAAAWIALSVFSLGCSGSSDTGLNLRGATDAAIHPNEPSGDSGVGEVDASTGDLDRADASSRNDASNGADAQSRDGGRDAALLDARPQVDAAPDSSTEACGNTTSRDECFDCCSEAHPGLLQIDNAVLFPCLCREDKCGPLCDACRDPNVQQVPGDPCTVCVEDEFAADAGAQSCGTLWYNACLDDADCTAGLNCQVQAGCNARP